VRGALHEVDDDAGEDERGKDDADEFGMAVSGDDGDDAAAVVFAEIGEDEVAHGAAGGESDEKFSDGILHGSGDEEKRNHGHGRRDHPGDRDGAETPAFKNFGDFIDSAFREFAFESFFAAFAREAVGDEAAEEGTERGHQGVVEPPLRLAGGEENGGDVHGAGDWERRIIEQREGNQADAAEVKKLAAQGSRRRRQQRGDGVAGEHRFYLSVCTKRARTAKMATSATADEFQSQLRQTTDAERGARLSRMVGDIEEGFLDCEATRPRDADEKRKESPLRSE
jgi:hypothetical protein